MRLEKSHRSPYQPDSRRIVIGEYRYTASTFHGEDGSKECRDNSVDLRPKFDGSAALHRLHK